MSVEQEILVTGIKVVDLLAPYAKGGKIGAWCPGTGWGGDMPGEGALHRSPLQQLPPLMSNALTFVLLSWLKRPLWL